MAKNASSLYVTPVVRTSYTQLTTPKASMGQKEKKFSVNLIFEPEDAGPLWAEIVKVATAEFGANALALFESGGLSNPLKNGSTPNKKTLAVDPTTAGKWFITAKAAEDKQPVCVAADSTTILNPSAIYSGCYVRARISIYAFKVPENQGVAIGLNYVQFVKDGERLGGGAPSVTEAKGVFTPVAGATPALPNMGFGTPVAPAGSLPALPN